MIGTNDVLSEENKNRKLALHEKYQKIPHLLAQGKTKSQICVALNMDDIRVYAKLIALADKETENFF